MDALIKWLTPLSLCIISWLLRLILILYGEVQDRVLDVKFTDIDYRVFSDAAAHVLNGDSPYERHTYRYTPLLAWLLVPNHILFYSFGKFVFITLDVLSGWLMYKILQLQNTPTHNQIIIACSFWLLNPLTAVVSSRGNAESIMAFLILLCLCALMKGRVFTSAVLYGFAVHMKIYPIIYSLPLVLSLGPTPWVRNTTSRFGLAIKWNRILTQERLMFVVVSMATFVLFTLSCYWLYGWQFLYEALLYHVTRTDIRHNFSVYFYMLYLTQGTGVSPFISMAAFIPQLVVVGVSGFRYHRDLPFCFFVQTFLFVTFNKVCTSQYFLWYLTFLPLIVPYLTQLRMKEAVIMLIVWFGAQVLRGVPYNYFRPEGLTTSENTHGMWLFSAYLLEYHGLNTFLFVWLAGILFFGVNVWIISKIIQNYDKKDTKRS